MAQEDKYIKQLIKLLDDSVNNFTDALPGLQEQIADVVQEAMGELERDSSGHLKANAKNFRQLTKIKSILNNVLDKTDYKKLSTQYLSAYTAFTDLSNNYFTYLSETFSPDAAMKAVQGAAIDSTVENLSKTGLMNAVNGTLKAPVLKQITNSIAAGTPYLESIKQMRQIVTGGNLEGPIERYAKPLAADSLNRFAANYINIGSIGLGLDWFQYVGPIIRTSRCWCIATLKIKYIHRSEFQRLIDMDFPEYDCEVYAKTGLADGMIEGTTPDNLIENRGGYGPCNHQFIPVPDNFVPADAKARII